jgi:S-DNA-T family DNA segregation ATPase FtsK/SpoIIIE
MTDSTPSHSDTHPDVDQANTGRFVVHRPPRSYPSPVPTGEVVLAAPPARHGGTGGWLATMLPLLGGAGSLLLLGATAPRRRWLILAVVASLLLSLGAGLVPLLRQRRAARRERARYLDHLDTVAPALERVAAAQRAAAEHLYPDLPAIMRLAAEDERLWERRAADEDFLAVRVGRGRVPLAAPVRLDRGPDPLAERDPQLLAAAEELVRRAGWLEAFPVIAPLRRTGVLAVTGPRAPARDLVRFLLAQLTVMHAPEDLRIIAACAPADVPVWEWVNSSTVQG